MADKTMYCEDCKQPFQWSEKDQDFYASKNFSPPKRCKPCREERKRRFAENKAKKGKSGRGNKGKSRGRRGVKVFR